MALEQHLISLAQNGVDGETDGASNGVDARPTSVDGDKTPRLPRWTRQEILVLIQGKRVAETRARRGRTSGLAFGSGQVEPKWASVSSYCKRHGVNRGPVQCRKRWSNLAGDFKKIKEWESQVKDETESFWVMRNDLRRERRLPGFFDKEVYDILDSGSPAAPEAPGLALALASGPAPASENTEEGGAMFDSGRTAAADDGMFSDFEQEESGRSPEKTKDTTVPAPMPISGKLKIVGLCLELGRSESQVGLDPHPERVVLALTYIFALFSVSLYLIFVTVLVYIVHNCLVFGFLFV
jgi:hypothetical protein